MKKILHFCAVFVSSMLLGLVFVVNAIAGMSFSNTTNIYYGNSHGVQVEFTSKKGGSFLWYPGNRRVVSGSWKQKGKNICFQYGSNTYNPVTKRSGGKWECQRVKYQNTLLKYSCKNDVFNLSSGKIPYVLSKRKQTLLKLKKHCS